MQSISKFSLGTMNMDVYWMKENMIFRLFYFLLEKLFDNKFEENKPQLYSSLFLNFFKMYCKRMEKNIYIMWWQQRQQ